MVADYVDKLAAEIGSPPDVAQGAGLVARLPVTVRIDGPVVHFDSHPDLHRPWSYDDGDPRHGPETWGLVRTTADGHRIVFGLTGPLHRASQARTFGWVTLAALLGLTLAAYAYVRRLLRPLDDIGAGVARFGPATSRSRSPMRAQRRAGRPRRAQVNTMAAEPAAACSTPSARCCWRSATSCASPLTRARVNAELVGEGEHRDALLRDLAEMRDLISDLLESERLATGHSCAADRARRSRSAGARGGGDAVCRRSADARARCVDRADARPTRCA